MNGVAPGATPFISFIIVVCVCNLFIRATNRGRWRDVRSVACLLPCNSLRYVLKL